MSIAKRYRLVIDYEVEIEDWSETVLANERKEYSDAGTPEFTKWEGYQQRLFAALIKNQHRVEKCCQRAILDVVEGDLERLLFHKEFNVPSEDALVVDAFKDLSQSDAAYWTEASRDEWFSEDSEFVRNRIQPYISNCRLQNLDTGDEIVAKPQELEDGECIVHSVETFGSWAQNDESLQVQTVTREGPRIGRNDYCPCGSGKKFKKCCAN